MTAVNVFRSADKVHVITDAGAVSLVSGRFICLVPKVATVPHLNCVMVTRGRIGIGRNVMRYATRMQSLDAIWTGLPLCLKGLYGWRSHLLPKIYGFELTIAGVRNGRSFVWMLHGKAWPEAKARAFEWVEPEGISAAPATEDFAFERLAEGFDKDRSGTKMLDDAALRLLNAQRERWPHAVTGHAEIATISQFGIYQRVLQRWNDKPGDSLETKS